LDRKELTLARRHKHSPQAELAIKPLHGSVIDYGNSAASTPSKVEGAPQDPTAPQILALLPIRNEVYFPHMIFPLLVGREKSVRALDEASSQQRRILIVTQSNVQVEDPSPEDIYSVGIDAEIMQILRVPDGTVRVMLSGHNRCKILRYVQTEPFYRVEVETLISDESTDLSTEALMRSVSAQFEHVVGAAKTIQPEALINVLNTDEPGRLADVITPYLRQMRFEAQQDILETIDVRERLEKLSIVLKKEAEILEIQRNIRSRVEKEMGDTQREYLLREQIKIIQQELGDREDLGAETDAYRSRITEAELPDAARERAIRETNRLERTPLASPEGAVIRTYLDSILSLPWSTSTTDRIDLEAAEQVLNQDHFGLEKVKERIIEFLAVRKLTGSAPGPILCFVGPPGVGKTSIGKSIAHALGRKFVRISLGGIRDEAEIRGHRRTYIGAMPGRILLGIKSAGSRNPVFMLDEVDKLGTGFRGDPASALLEALDPTQNHEYSDHYLEIPFDLSDVLFVTTANLLEYIPPPLRDRLEVIEFAGYTEEEKLSIAREFLMARQLNAHGLTSRHLIITDCGLRKLIRAYTREAGVRGLEREIANVCRKVARKVVAKTSNKGEDAMQEYVTDGTLHEYLGKFKYQRGLIEPNDEIAAATGLVYTEFGGDICTIEVSLLRAHEGSIQLTGHLGEVMKESAQTAFSFIRSRAVALEIDEEFYRKYAVHVHVPAGAVPKDGPSAGITIATAIASALTGRAVRRDVAMTGEITLRGRVLPVGGVKEKVLAANRAGIRIVVLPAENENDLDDLSQDVLAATQCKLVTNMDEVLEAALVPRRKRSRK
jgi:ATP-dependent Lon protease